MSGVPSGGGVVMAKNRPAIYRAKNAVKPLSSNGYGRRCTAFLLCWFLDLETL